MVKAESRQLMAISQSAIRFSLFASDWSHLRLDAWLGRLTTQTPERATCDGKLEPTRLPTGGPELTSAIRDGLLATGDR